VHTRFSPFLQTYAAEQPYREFVRVVYIIAIGYAEVECLCALTEAARARYMSDRKLVCQSVPQDPAISRYADHCRSLILDVRGQRGSVRRPRLDRVVIGQCASSTKPLPTSGKYLRYWNLLSSLLKCFCTVPSAQRVHHCSANTTTCQTCRAQITF
jgi:hypothetical protein